MYQTFTRAIASLCLLFSIHLNAQTPIANTSPVVQNFDGIGNTATATIPANWKMSAAGTTANWLTAGNVTVTSETASSGTPTAGGRYNWATTAGTDRAIGFMTSGGYASPNTILAHYQNTSGNVISTLKISFNVERYRTNTAAASVAFFTSTDGSTWTAQSAGDVLTTELPTGSSSYSFASPLTITKNVTVGSLSLPNNGNFYIRWVFNTTGSNAQGLALDDVSLTAIAPVVTARLGAHVIDANANGTANPGEIITYRDTVKNSGNGSATGVTATYPANANADYVAASLQTSALARDDNYTSSNGTILSGQNVITNDYGIPNPTVVSYGTTGSGGTTTLVAQGNGVTDMGGTISITASGVITYTPPSNFCGIDKFAYVATTGVAGLPDNNAIVTITVSSNITFNTIDVQPCNAQANGSITVNASGAAVPFTYSKDGGTNYQPSNVFTGLAAGTYSIVVKAGTCTATASRTLAEAAAILPTGNIPNQVINTAMTPVTYTKSGGVGSPANPWSATGLPTGITINTATGQVSGTPTVTGSFSATITYTDANGCTGNSVDVFNVAPKLTNDAYNVVGNTQLVSDGHSTPLTPFTSSGTNIRANDQADVNIAITPVTNAATTNGGSITIDAQGKFTYSPSGGSTAADSYTYTGTSNGISATAVINFTVGNMVWYVNNTYGGASTGRSHQPFIDVASAEAQSLANQIIYVHTGSGNTPGNALLKIGQTLRGAGSALTVGALSLVAATKPTLSGMITLNNSVTVDGFDMSTGATTAITSPGATSVNVSVGNVTTSGAVNAIHLTNTTGSVSIAGGTLTGGAGTVFNVNGGSATIACGSTINQTTGSQRLVNIQSITGGSVTLSGNLSSTGSSTGLNVASNSGGAITFSGATKTFNTATSTPITLSSNTGASISFTNGGLDVDVTTATGFTATGGGTVAVSGSNNSLTATTGTALNVVNTTIGTSGLTFQSISSNGGSATGIILENTGNTGGGFTITGTGTTAGSGGTIANKTGTDGQVTAGCGMYLNNTRNISLTNMIFTGPIENFGIRGDAVNNFILKESHLTGVFGTLNSGVGAEATIRFGAQGNDGTGNGLTGTVFFTGNTISGGISDNLAIFNNNTGTMNMTVNEVGGGRPAVFGHNAFDGNDGILIETRGPSNGATIGHPGGTAGAGFNLTLSINGVEFQGARGDNIQTVAATNCTQNITITNNTFFNTHPNIVSGGGGITLSGGGGTSNYIVSYNVSSNQFKGAVGTPLHVNYSGASAAITGIIVSNIIGTPNGTYNSGSGQVGSSGNGNGINVTSEKFGDQVAGAPHSTGVITHAVRIQNNVVADINGLAGIRVSAGTQDEGGSLRIEGTITGNTVSEMGPFGYAAFYAVVGGASLTTDFSKVGLNITGNTFNAGGAGATTSGNAMSFDQISQNARYYFPGYAGSQYGENTLPPGPGTASANLNTFMQDATHLNVLTNGPFPNPSAGVGSKVDASSAVGVLGTAFTLPVPLMVSSVAPENHKIDERNLLTEEKVKGILDACIKRWANAGANGQQIKAMKAVSLQINNIPGNFIGSSEKGVIKLDQDAAGYGWYFDLTPNDDKEFSGTGTTGFSMDVETKGKIDLLTVLMHELGHQIGIEDEYQLTESSKLTYGFLNPGERRLPVFKRSMKASQRSPSITPILNAQ